MTVTEFLLGVTCVASVVLQSIALLILRDIRDDANTTNAILRLEAKRRDWVRQEHASD